MSSEELACKLQRRLRLETRAETHQDSPQAAPCTAPAGHREPEPPAPAPTVSADSELNLKLSSRLNIHQGAVRSRRSKVFNPYTEFPEFSRRLLKDLERMFKTYDAGKDGFIDLMELKLMMEKLGAPQTHLGLKNMIQEVDEDFDGKLSFREFLLIFHKAAAGELQEDSGLLALAKFSEINVALEGVRGAKNFFEAKGPTDGTQVVKFGTKLSGQPSVETLKGSDSPCWTDCTAIGQKWT
ncbi:EF-hand domain-containing protein D1 isoform X1 [Rattus norvegicus]|uniref:EF-hand domain family, member D1 n=1 Tax=Rattus norvegicus TaxID=10116 RepID=A0ABK0L716_RAT|nr:EF-hand domain-containing protein D1 isoform X1 [Rattus norvegicus]